MKKLKAIAVVVLVALAATARAEEKDLRAVIEVELEDLSEFSLQKAPQPKPMSNEPSTAFRALGFATYGIMGTELITSELGEASGKFREANFLLRNRAANIGVHIAGAIAVTWASDEVRKGGHPKTALWMRILTVAAYSVLTANNLSK